jgi:hypothetical protein
MIRWLFPPQDGAALLVVLFVVLPLIASAYIALALAVAWWIGWL